MRLQVLLRKDARNPRGIADVEAGLRALGLEVTGSGRTSVSARATADVFDAVFGEHARDLRVPQPLADRVESISVAPAHTAMTRRSR
jgi:hypothetical protein